jgi:hypothetical protein
MLKPGGGSLIAREKKNWESWVDSALNLSNTVESMLVFF